MRRGKERRMPLHGFSEVRMFVRLVLCLGLLLVLGRADAAPGGNSLPVEIELRGMR